MIRNEDGLLRGYVYVDVSGRASRRLIIEKVKLPPGYAQISEVRAKIASYLSREMGIPMAEIARNLDVGTSAIAMAVKKNEASQKHKH